MDPLERINEVLATLRQRAIAWAGQLHPALLAEVAQDHREIAEHERRLEGEKRAASQPRQPAPRLKTTEEMEAEKQEREIQTRVRKALADLEAERRAAGDDE